MFNLRQTQPTKFIHLFAWDTGSRAHKHKHKGQTDRQTDRETLWVQSKQQ